MNVDDGVEVADEALFIHIGRRLSNVETAILKGAWQGQTYDEIADETNYSISYLKRHVGPDLWKVLTTALGEPVNKMNFRMALERQWRSRRISDPALQPQSELSHPTADLPVASSNPPMPTTHPMQPIGNRIDWGEVIDVSAFYGRATELATLNQWIVGDRCRLVTLLGMGGIGKTALSVKLTNQILIAASMPTLQTPIPTAEFEYVIWRSLRNAPPLETLLLDLIVFLSNQQDTQATLDRLMYYLRSSRCLIILDNLETVLQDGQNTGQFRLGYEDYDELLRRVSESQHQSCGFLTSREKPAVVAAFEGGGLKVRSLSLGGSREAAQALLQAKQLVGSAAQKQQLSDRYGNSPLALKIVATSIQDIFDGEIASFLEQDTAVFNGVRRLLDQHFARLSVLEQTILYWLAINREWTTIAELQADILPAVSKAKLLESLESLNWRSLVEKKSGSYTQQPVVMEYITEQFIEQIGQELTTAPLSLYSSHALIETNVKDYVRESQIRLILQPIAEQFCQTFSSTSSQAQQVFRIALALRNTEITRSGYGSGNLINLCNHAQINLADYDFSEVTIRHAYLQNVNLHRVNFAYADFHRSVFTQTFGSILSIAFSPDGKLLATGDTIGDVQLWQVADGQKKLTCQGHTNRVWSVGFSPDGNLLASSGDDCIIRLWHTQTGKCISLLQGHSDWVHAITFSADGQTLVSGSDDRTIKCWQTSTGECLKTL